MSIAKPQPGTTPNELASLFEPVAAELTTVSQRLKSELRHPDPAIHELAQHSFRMGGKRLRPSLLLLTAQAVGKVNESHRVLAAVVEMIHTATLVHDDVLDEATIRRHEATVNARWNNQSSILLGDYLFSHAFYLASTLETTIACQAIGRATKIVCAGELKQTAACGDFDLSRAAYLEIIDAKTAELCACCCQLGAHFAGASQQLTSQLASYGRHLGIAFQIADDLLDLEGDERVAGKSLGTDLSNFKMTLPLIHLRDQLEESQRGELRQLIEQPGAGNRSRLFQWLVETSSLQHAREVAEEHATSAIALLAELPGSNAHQTLQQIAHFVVERSY
ncbi:MAG: polyprenyl synthetase family protein [Bythopirellula sp.]